MNGKRTFCGLFGVNFLVTLGFGIIDVFFTPYLIGMGIRGLMLAMPAVMYAVSKMLFGAAVNRFVKKAGLKFSMLSALFVFFAVSVGYCLTKNIMLLILFRMIQGIAVAVFRPVLFVYVTENISNDKGRYLGLFDRSFYIAVGAGPVIGGAVKDAAGYDGLFILLAVLCAFAFLLLLIAGGDRREIRNNDDANGINAISHTLFGLGVFIFGRGFCVISFFSYLQIIMSEKFFASSLTVGFASAAVTLASVGALSHAGTLADRTDRRHLIVIGGFSLALLYVAAAFTSDTVSFFILCFMIGGVSMISQPACSSVLAETGAGGLCRAASVFNTFMYAGSACGAVVSAAVYSAYGAEAVFCLAAAVGASSTYLSAVLMFRRNEAVS